MHQPFLHLINIIINNNNVQIFIVTMVLHNLRLLNNFFAHGLNLGYWVKLHSTTWLSMFLLIEYDNQWWIQNSKCQKRHYSTL
jgi:hypothetical protein